MRDSRRSRAAYSNVAATLALLVALGGTAYAAATVTSADIVNRTIQIEDIAKGARDRLQPYSYQWGKAGFGQITAATTVKSFSLPRGPWMVMAKLWLKNDWAATSVNCMLTAGTHDPYIYTDIVWEDLAATSGAGDTATVSLVVVAYLDGKDKVTFTCTPTAGSVSLFDVKVTTIRLGYASIDTT